MDSVANPYSRTVLPIDTAYYKYTVIFTLWKKYTLLPDIHMKENAEVKSHSFNYWSQVHV